MELRNRIVCIVGPKGTGKTETAAGIYGKCDRAVVFNVAHDKQYRVRSTVFLDGDIKSLDKVMRHNDKFRICFESDAMIRKGSSMIYVDLDDIILDCMANPPITLFLDEAHLLCKADNVTNETLRAVYISRHHAMSMVFIMQRMAGVHPDIRFNADEYHFFKINEPADIDIIKQKFGKEVAEQVRDLRRLDYVNGRVVPGQQLVWNVEDDKISMIDPTRPPKER